MLLKVKPTLKHLRQQNGYTQHQFSSILHVHQTTYSKIESGAIILKPDVAFRITEILHVSLEDFAEVDQPLFRFEKPFALNNKGIASDSNVLHGLRMEIEEISSRLQSLVSRLNNT